MRFIRLLEAGATPLSQFMVLVVASRGLASEDFSHFVLALSVGNLVTVAGLGMHITQQVEIPKQQPPQAWTYHAACRWLLVPIALALMLACGGIGLALGTDRSWVYMLGVTYGLCLILDQVMAGGLRAFGAHDTVTRLDLGAKLCTIAGTALFAPMGTAACVGQLMVIQIISSAWKARRLRDFKPPQPGMAQPMATVWQQVKHIALSSKGPLLQQAGAQMFSSADKVVMGAMGATNLLGIYAILQQTSAAIQIIPAQFLQPTIAQVAGSSDRPERTRRLLQSAATCVAMITLLATALYTLHAPVFQLFFGLNGLQPDEHKALVTMILVYALISAQTPFIYFLQGVGATIEVGMTWISSGILALALMTVLAPTATSLSDFVELRAAFGIGLIPLLWLTLKKMNRD